MFKDFAKVFDTDVGQVLVRVDEWEEGGPCLSFCCAFEDGRTINMNIGGWGDNDAGWQKAFDALELANAEQAENFLTKIVPQILGE